MNTGKGPHITQTVVKGGFAETKVTFEAELDFEEAAVLFSNRSKHDVECFCQS